MVNCNFVSQNRQGCHILMKQALNKPIFTIISSVAKQQGTSAYVVGGFVRDFLLKRITTDPDIDIVVVGNGIEIAS